MKRNLITDIEADRLGFHAVEIARERADMLDTKGDHAGAVLWREKALAFAEYFAAEEAKESRHSNTNPNDIELNAGVAGLYLKEPVFLSPGLLIKPTYAHVMSPFVLAFARPEMPGAGHPGPWKSASGGAAINLHAQITIMRSTSVGGFDRLNSIWFLAALMRLTISNTIRVPVISDMPFSDVADKNGDPCIWPIELRRPRHAALQLEVSEATLGIAWISDHLKDSAAMMTQEGFALAFRTFDEAAFAESLGTAMVLLWSSLEALFRPGKHQITKKLSQMIATYLTDDPRERDRIYQQVCKLYGTRGLMVHAARPPMMETVEETAKIARQALMRAFEDRKIPDPDRLNLAWSERIDY